jgi:predicted nucleic acid-binding protein
MTGLQLWDTCSYVRRFQDVAIDRRIATDIRSRRFVLCSVVAMELYAGTRDSGTKRAIDALVRFLHELDLLVSPTFDDYRDVGIGLRRYRRARGAIDTRAHFRDALITTCAARIGAVIVTENLRDFERWGRWLRPGVRPRVATPEDR